MNTVNGHMMVGNYCYTCRTLHCAKTAIASASVGQFNLPRRLAEQNFNVSREGVVQANASASFAGSMPVFVFHLRFGASKPRRISVSWNAYSNLNRYMAGAGLQGLDARRATRVGDRYVLEISDFSALSSNTMLRLILTGEEGNAATLRPDLADMRIQTFIG